MVRRTPRSRIFDELAKKTKAELAPYKKCIAIMKELQDWGPDEQRREFKFEVFQHPWFPGQPTMILGSYGSKEERESGGKVAAFLLGMPSREEGFEFEVRDGWYQKTGAAYERASDPCVFSSSRFCRTADTLHQAVIDFVELRMKDHPRFKAALQAATEKATGKIKPMSPV